MPVNRHSGGIDLRPPAVFAARVLMILGVVGAFGGTVDMWVDTDTGIIAALAMASVGCLAGWMAAVGEYPAVWTVVTCHFTGAVLFFGLSWAANKHPDAANPFCLLVIAALYAAGVVRPTRWAWAHRPTHARPPGVCRGCGYSLRGLSTFRCTECGRPFDRSELPV